MLCAALGNPAHNRHLAGNSAFPTDISGKVPLCSSFRCSAKDGFPGACGSSNLETSTPQQRLHHQCIGCAQMLSFDYVQRPVPFLSGLIENNIQNGPPDCASLGFAQQLREISIKIEFSKCLHSTCQNIRRLFAASIPNHTRPWGFAIDFWQSSCMSAFIQLRVMDGLDEVTSTPSTHPMYQQGVPSIFCRNCFQNMGNAIPLQVFGPPPMIDGP